MEPSHIERLVLRNVRCFEDADIPLHHRVTLLVGENGAGKSTIAEVLGAFVSDGRDDPVQFPLRRGATDGHATLYAHDEEVPVARWIVQNERETVRETLSARRYVFGYGQYRRVDVEQPLQKLGGMDILSGHEAALLDAPRIEDHLATLVLERRVTTLYRPDPMLFRDLGRYILYLDERRQVDQRVARAWERLNTSFRYVHGLERVDVIVRDDRRVPVVVRRGVPLELRELSAGYQSLLVIALDLVLRYVSLFVTLDDPLVGEATVIVDEIDLHLHPRWQRTVVEQLATLFPATQLVLTTHSAAVVQGTIDSRTLQGDYGVVVLRERDGGAVSAQALDRKALRDLRGAQVSSLLVDARLFGVPSRWSLRYEKLERKVRRLRRKAEAGTATDAEREALVAALDRLQGLLAREEERLAERPLLSEIAKTQVAFLKRHSAAKGARDGSP